MRFSRLHPAFRQRLADTLRITVCAALVYAAIYGIAWCGNSAIGLMLPYAAHSFIPFTAVAIIAALLYSKVAKMWCKWVVRSPGSNHYSTRAQWVSIIIVVAAFWLSAGVQTLSVAALDRWGTLPSAAQGAEILAAATIIGFHEELIWRVLMFDILILSTRRAWVAIPLTAVMFMATHEPNWYSVESWLWYGIPSLYVTAMYWATRSYVAVALGHALVDASLWLLVGYPKFPFRSITELASISPYLMNAFVVVGLGTQLFFARRTGQSKLALPATEESPR